MHLSGNATSMIGLCQEGHSSPDALRRSVGVISLVSSPRVLASEPWFLLNRRTRLPFAGTAFSAAQKIEFVFACQSRNLSVGASRACAPSPSRVNGKTWQARVEESLLVHRRALRSGAMIQIRYLKIPLPAIDRHKIGHQLPRYRQRGPVGIAFLLFSVIEHR
jgi:hypothetical protein